jgi:hypothetical protein
MCVAKFPNLAGPNRKVWLSKANWVLFNPA